MDICNEKTTVEVCWKLSSYSLVLIYGWQSTKLHTPMFYSNDLETLLNDFHVEPESRLDATTSGKHNMHAPTPEWANTELDEPKYSSSIGDHIHSIRRSSPRRRQEIGVEASIKKKVVKRTSTPKRPKTLNAAASSIKKGAQEAAIAAFSEQSQKKFFCTKMLRSKIDGSVMKCDKGFNRRHDLTRHENTVHCPRLNDIVCDTCGVEFTRVDALNRHLAVKRSECGQQRRRKIRSRTYDITEMVEERWLSWLPYQSIFNSYLVKQYAHFYLCFIFEFFPFYSYPSQDRLVKLMDNSIFSSFIIILHVIPIRYSFCNSRCTITNASSTPCIKSCWAVLPTCNSDFHPRKIYKSTCNPPSIHKNSDENFFSSFRT